MFFNKNKQAHSHLLIHEIIGEKIPDYELDICLNGKVDKLKLSDYRGKWLILFFYPADFTFVCPTELEALASIHAEAIKLNAEIISISTDTVHTHKVWHEQSESVRKVKFPMAADHNGKFSKKLNVYQHDNGMSRRASFIVDPGGMVNAFEVNSDQYGRNASELLRKLKAAIHVRENPNEMCPANWHPGDKTIQLK